MISASVAQLVEPLPSKQTVVGSYPITRSIIPAPQWMVDRMEALKKLPPPTLEQVQTQFEASARFCRATAVVEGLLEHGVFISAVLTPESHSRLLAAFPAIHPVVYAHHVTLAFNPDEETAAKYHPLEGQRIQVPVTAVASNEHAQAVLVEVMSENKYPHITISVAEGVPAKYSNELFTVAEVKRIPSFTLEADVVIEPLSPPV